MQSVGQPGYAQVLSVIGRSLDDHGYHSLILCELDDGFVARVTRPDGWTEAIPYPRSDLADLASRAAGAGRTAMTGSRPGARSFIGRTAGSYEAFLAPLGRQCDRLRVHSVLVVELEDAVLVSYRPTRAVNDPITPADYEYLYFEDGLRQLLKENTPSGAY
jgi:hypothetical protein